MKALIYFIFWIAVAAGFLLAIDAHSQTTHTTDYKAIQQSINSQVGADCVLISGGRNEVLGGTITRKPLSVKVDKVCLRAATSKDTVTAVITWIEPTKREDGTALASGDIAEYKIVHLYKGDLDETIVPAPDLGYSMEWGAGIHDVAISVIDIYGLESQLSGVISKTVP